VHIVLYADLAMKCTFLIILSFTELSAAPRLQQYDCVGNTVFQNRGGANTLQSLLYNSQNGMIRARGSRGAGLYAYSDNGLRLRKLTQQGELLNPGEYLTLEKNSNTSGPNMGLTNHIYLNGVRIATVGPTSSGAPAIRYYLGDQVSSVKVVLDGRGNILSRHEYFPYGEEFVKELAKTVSVPILSKFNSQERDKESGLDFFNARHYDSGIARFVGADTVIAGETSAMSWNRYFYTQGNPIKYADATGNVIVIDDKNIKHWKRLKSVLKEAGKTQIGKNLIHELKNTKHTIVIEIDKKIGTPGFTTPKKGNIVIKLNPKMIQGDIDSVLVHEMQHAANWDSKDVLDIFTNEFLAFNSQHIHMSQKNKIPNKTPTEMAAIHPAVTEQMTKAQIQEARLQAEQSQEWRNAGIELGTAVARLKEIEKVKDKSRKKSY
jgi:RHS repeat-associated protein